MIEFLMPKTYRQVLRQRMAPLLVVCLDLNDSQDRPLRFLEQLAPARHQRLKVFIPVRKGMEDFYAEYQVTKKPVVLFIFNGQVRGRLLQALDISSIQRFIKRSMQEISEELLDENSLRSHQGAPRFSSLS